MDALMGHVPLYPLAPALFLVAATLFGLQMARHLRVFSRARPASVTGHGEARAGSLVRFAIVQVRMFRDRPVGLMHAAIFWGFIVLTIGTADRVAFGLVHSVLGWPLDGWPWRVTLAVQSLLAVMVLAAHRVGALPPPGGSTVEADALARRAAHPAAHRGRGAQRAPGGSVPCGALWRPRRGMGLRSGCCVGSAVPSARCRDARGRLRGLLLAEHPARVHVPCLAAALQAPPHRDRVLQCRVPEAGAAGRAARHGPRDRDRPVRGQDDRGPVLEGPARRVHVHRMRTLCRRLPGVGDWQAARPQDAHHGHPGHGRRGRAGSAAPAVHAGGDRPRPRPGGAGPAHRGRRHPVRGGLGLRDLRCVRRGLPGGHRARGQDRGIAPQPGAGGEQVPGRAQRRLHGHGAPRRPVGRAGIGAHGLDEGAALRGAHCGAGRQPRVRTPSRTWNASTGSVVRRRSTSATDAWRARS